MDQRYSAPAEVTMNRTD
jgi:glycine cleavage system regulatory protein